MRAPSGLLRGIVPVIISVALLWPAPASGQTTARPAQPRAKPAQPRAKAVKKDPKWTFEVLGGGAFGSGPGGGTALTPFPAGTPFTTQAGLPSRVNPSWFFGDGTALFNEVSRQFASQFNVQFPSLVPLDAAFRAAGTSRQAGAIFGARVTRRLSPRLAVEVGLEWGGASLELTGAARDAIEATRTSFEAGFRGLLATVPQTGLQVSSTADIPDASGAQAAFTAALNISFWRKGRLGAHATVGAGSVRRSGGSLDVRIRGGYQFRFLDNYPINESDSVTIQFADRDSAFLGVFGGGLAYDLTPRQGLRVDVRVHATGGGYTTGVSASSTVFTGTPPIALPSNTSPGIQFSNSGTWRSSLGGSTSGLQAFKGDGLDLRTHVTASFLFRF